MLGVHHTNKKGDTRGSILLTQNTDFWMFTTRKNFESMTVELAIGKLKDAPAGQVEGYHLDTVIMDDGKTSLVPVRIGEEDLRQAKATAGGRPPARANEILDALRKFPDSATLGDIYDLMEVYDNKEKNAIRRALYRMLADGKVAKTSSKWRIAKTSGFFD